MKCKIAWSGTEPDQNSPGHAPCRYRVPFDARRARPTLWSSHSFLITTSRLFHIFASAPDCTAAYADTVLTGCPRARVRSARRPEGEEGCTTKEGPGQEGHEGVDTLLSRLIMLCTSLSSAVDLFCIVIFMYPCFPTPRVNKLMTWNHRTGKCVRVRDAGRGKTVRWDISRCFVCARY